MVFNQWPTAVAREALRKRAPGDWFPGTHSYFILKLLISSDNWILQKTKVKVLTHSRSHPREENWPSISQVLGGPLLIMPWSSVLCPSWKRKCLCLFQLFLIYFLPLSDYCFGRDWFLLPQSCQEKMNCSLSTWTLSTTHSFIHFFIAYINCYILSLIPRQRQRRIDLSLSPKTALVALSCTTTKQHGIWKTHETEREETIF